MLQWEHSAILMTFIKLPFVIKILTLSILKGRFSQVLLYIILVAVVFTRIIELNRFHSYRKKKEYLKYLTFSSFAVILKRKRELNALLLLSYGCLVTFYVL